jgi:hypothetical protein
MTAPCGKSSGSILRPSVQIGIISALSARFQPKQLIFDLVIITTIDIMPPFKFLPQGQSKSAHDSLVVRLKLGQYPLADH